MLLHDQLQLTHELATPEHWTTIQQHLPEAWLERALTDSGIATLRRRRLPLQQAIWLVLGMALLRDRSIVEVAERLDLALPGATCPVSSALVQARQRLGSEPLERLFRLTAQYWTLPELEHSRCQGWRVVALDGVVWRTPDTAENRAAFGGQRNRPGHHSPFPNVRSACLMDVRSRLLLDATLDAYDVSEYRLAARLLPSLPEQSILLIDKGFFSASLLWPLQHRDHRHWLIPARAGLRGTLIARYGHGDGRLRMPVSPAAHRKDPTLPATWEARVVTRRLPNGDECAVLTTLDDPEAWPADVVFELYRERWEIELAFAELKNELLHCAMTLRSQTAQGVRQELWATLVMYNLVRLEMTRIAEEAGVEPIRISFITALHYIIDEWLWSTSAAPGTIPKKLRAMRRNIQRFVLPRRRSTRRYPRAVRMSKTRYPIMKNATQSLN
ncbi:MAG: IS4 family transposase [Pseudomonadota bacterium]